MAPRTKAKPANYKPEYEPIAAIFRKTLKDKDWTKGDFNVAMGRDHGYTGFNYWFRAGGRPIGENLVRAAKVCGVSVEDLTPKEKTYNNGKPRASPGASTPVTTPLDALAQSNALVPYRKPGPKPRADAEAKYDFKTKTMLLTFECRVPIDVGLDVIRMVQNNAIQGDDEGAET